MSELEPGAKMVEIKKKVGRPPHQPTDRTKHLVEEAVGMGLEQVKIAQLMDIAPKTLRRCYRYELDVGVIKANLSVAKSIWRTFRKNLQMCLPGLQPSQISQALI